MNIHAWKGNESENARDDFATTNASDRRQNTRSAKRVFNVSGGKACPGAKLKLKISRRLDEPWVGNNEYAMTPPLSERKLFL